VGIDFSARNDRAAIRVREDDMQGMLIRPLDGLATGLILVSATLMTIGIVMLSSCAATLDGTLFDAPGWQVTVVRQACFALVGVALLVSLARVGPGMFRWREDTWFQPSVLVLIASIGLLLLVWVPGVGVVSHGRSRWVSIGPLGFQPSEVAKIAIVGFLAAVLTRRRDIAATDKPDLTIPLVVLAVVCGMVGLEDFGTAALIVGVGLCMLFMRGVCLSTVLAWSVPVIGASVVLIFQYRYRIDRLFAFLNIWDDPQGAGYHPIQSLAAIVSGGWTGTGLGAGLAKYGYLPEARTDFIFSILCEETGVLGGAFVVLLFVAFAALGLLTMVRASSSDNGFSKLFAFGVTLMVVTQAVINIAVVTVVAPTKGISLPFVSAGGSGVLCLSVAVGLLAGVQRSSVRRVADVADRFACHEPGLLTGGS
jgi:cell division protein FtsW